jgi:hypothetical protein
MTQEKWFAKLKGFLPGWFWEKEDINVAIMGSVAKVLEVLDADREEHIDNTFITKAEGEFVDLHGDERSVERLADEDDTPYSGRIRSLKNQSNFPAIKRAVDSILVVGECELLEEATWGPFASRGTFANRNENIFEASKNAFAVRIQPGNDSVFPSIVAAINDAKAHGVLYRVIELREL